jgi:PRTRC genetic system protein E
MFKELAPLLRQRSVLLSLTRLEDDTIRVNVFPKKLADGENEALTTPLSVTGTAEELDAQLPSALTEYVGLNLGLSSTLETVKEQVAAAAKAAKDDARSKTAKPAAGKTEPAKSGAASTSAAKPQSAQHEDRKTPAAVVKPAVPNKAAPLQTASLFDFGAPAPAPAASSDSDDVNDEEDEIMAEIEAEIEAEDVGEEGAIAA